MSIAAIAAVFTFLYALVTKSGNVVSGHRRFDEVHLSNQFAILIDLYGSDYFRLGFYLLGLLAS